MKNAILIDKIREMDETEVMILARCKGGNFYGAFARKKADGLRTGI